MRTLTNLRPLLSCVLLGLAACDPDESDTVDDTDEPAATPAFELSPSTDKAPVLQGSTASVDVTVTRNDGFTGAVTISAVGLPDGVTAQDVTIAEGQTEATIVLTATASAPHSLPTDVALIGTSGDLEDEQALTVTVYGPPGSLDTSFAGGQVVLPAGISDDYAYAVAAQADGKLVLAGTSAGEIAVMRLTRDGALDTTFGTDGVATIAIGNGDVAYAVAVQPDGKILVAGATTGATTGRDFALVRLLTDGSPDGDFGDDGIVTTSFTDDSDTAYAMLLQPDGRIVLGGEANLGSSASGVDFAVARYEADGTLDDGFGEDGKVTAALASFSARDTIYALALDDEDRIVAAGGEGDFKVARFLDDGALDASFSEDGKVVGLFGSTIGTARAVQIDADGGIVLAGHSHENVALARLDDAGALDAGFGDGGTVLTALSADNWDEARGLAVEADGHLVVAGWVYEGNTSAGDFAVVRYDEDGALDAGFGNAGIVITPGLAANRRDEGNAVVLQADERVPTTRIVVAGSAGGGSNSDFAVARYWR